MAKYYGKIIEEDVLSPFFTQISRKQYGIVHQWVRSKFSPLLPDIFTIPIGTTYLGPITRTSIIEGEYVYFYDDKDHPLMHALRKGLEGNNEALDCILFSKEFHPSTLEGYFNFLAGINILDLFCPSRLEDYFGAYRTIKKMESYTQTMKIPFNYHYRSIINPETNEPYQFTTDIEPNIEEGLAALALKDHIVYAMLVKRFENFKHEYTKIGTDPIVTLLPFASYYSVLNFSLGYKSFEPNRLMKENQKYVPDLIAGMMAIDRFAHAFNYEELIYVVCGAGPSRFCILYEQLNEKLKVKDYLEISYSNQTKAIYLPERYRFSIQSESMLYEYDNDHKTVVSTAENAQKLEEHRRHGSATELKLCVKIAQKYQEQNWDFFEVLGKLHSANPGMPLIDFAYKVLYDPENKYDLRMYQSAYKTLLRDLGMDYEDEDDDYEDDDFEDDDLEDDDLDDLDDDFEDDDFEDEDDDIEDDW
ncbi:MAG: hypothetical protein QXQ37_07090 [Nitrososphaerota archaeon]